MLYKTCESVDEPDRHKRTALHLQYNANNEVVKSLSREYQGNHIKQTCTRYHYDAFSRRIAKHSETRQLQIKQNSFKQQSKTQSKHTHMLWDGDKLIQEYSDNHVFTTVYDQASFAPVARLAWLREETINEQVSEQDKDWLTKFNKWEQNQRLDPRDLPQLYDDYIKKDKLEAILGIKVYYYHNDQLGTPNELTNEKGEVIWLADLAAWGNVSKEEYQSQAIGDFEISAEDLQPVRFQGQSFDSETGLHYNRFRYYDPDMGMFISRDPIGLMGGDNVFAYAPNPTGWIDPLGLEGIHIKETQNYEIIQPGPVRKYVPFFNNPTVNYLDTYTVNSIEFDSNIEGVKITRRKPILYPHNLNSGHYETYIGTGDDFDNIEWKKQPCTACAFANGLNVGWTTGLSGAVGSSAGRTVSARYSLTNVLNNPKLIWGKSAERIAQAFRKDGYSAVIRGSNRANNQSKIIEINGHRQITQIQVSPSSSRHGGMYYKISTSDRGIIKVVDRSTYKPTLNEKATIIYK